MTPSKPPTPQGISALLKRAGFPRSESRGRSGRCSGFVVSKDFTRGNAVRVRHHFWSMGATPEQHQQKLAEYTQTLAAAGWNVDDGGRELIVTAGKEG